MFKVLIKKLLFIGIVFFGAAFSLQAPDKPEDINSSRELDKQELANILRLLAAFERVEETDAKQRAFNALESAMCDFCERKLTAYTKEDNAIFNKQPDDRLLEDTNRLNNLRSSALEYFPRVFVKEFDPASGYESNKLISLVKSSAENNSNPTQFVKTCRVVFGSKTDSLLALPKEYRNKNRPHLGAYSCEKSKVVGYDNVKSCVKHIVFLLVSFDNGVADAPKGIFDDKRRGQWSDALLDYLEIKKEDLATETPPAGPPPTANPAELIQTGTGGGANLEGGALPSLSPIQSPPPFQPQGEMTRNEIIQKDKKILSKILKFYYAFKRIAVEAVDERQTAFDNLRQSISSFLKCKFNYYEAEYNKGGTLLDRDRENDLLILQSNLPSVQRDTGVVDGEVVVEAIICAENIVIVDNSVPTAEYKNVKCVKIMDLTNVFVFVSRILSYVVEVDHGQDFSVIYFTGVDFSLDLLKYLEINPEDLAAVPPTDSSVGRQTVGQDSGEKRIGPYVSRGSGCAGSLGGACDSNPGGFVSGGLGLSEEQANDGSSSHVLGDYLGGDNELCDNSGEKSWFEQNRKPVFALVAVAIVSLGVALGTLTKAGKNRVAKIKAWISKKKQARSTQKAKAVKAVKLAGNTIRESAA